MRESDTVHLDQISRIVDLLQGKRTVHILLAMQAVLKRLYPAVSKKALRAGLRDLEQANVVVRHDLSNVVLHVAYQILEDLRETVCTALASLSAVGELLITHAQRLE